MANKQFLDEDVFKFDEEDEVVTKQALPSKPIQTPPEEKVIQTKPILEVRELEDNPYRERYQAPKREVNNQHKKNNQRKKPLKQEVAAKKLISISQKNLEVVKILREISKSYPSESEFICQAIIEKYHRENEVKETDIKTLVRDALEELVGDKYIIMKGSSDVSVVNQGYVPNVGNVPVINQSSINKAISNQDASENKSLLAGMLDDMDDDDDL